MGIDTPAAWNQDVQQKLMSTGIFAAVDTIEVNSTGVLPALGSLLQYDAILVYSNFQLNGSPDALGDLLGLYIDGGGGVVDMLLTGIQPTPLGGRFRERGYALMQPGFLVSGVRRTTGSRLAATPILAGVAEFDGGTSSFLSSGAPVDGADVPVFWNGDFTNPLAVTGSPKRPQPGDAQLLSSLERYPAGLLGYHYRRRSSDGQFAAVRCDQPAAALLVHAGPGRRVGSAIRFQQLHQRYAQRPTLFLVWARSGSLGAAQRRRRNGASGSRFHQLPGRSQPRLRASYHYVYRGWPALRNSAGGERTSGVFPVSDARVTPREHPIRQPGQREFESGGCGLGRRLQLAVDPNHLSRRWRRKRPGELSSEAESRAAANRDLDCRGPDLSRDSGIHTMHLLLRSDGGPGALYRGRGTNPTPVERPDCPRTVSSDARWLTVTSTSSGLGNSVIAYAVTENSSANPRVANLSVGSRLFPVTQAGAPITFTINPTSASFPSSGGAAAVALTRRRPMLPGAACAAPCRGSPSPRRHPALAAPISVTQWRRTPPRRRARARS